MARPRFFRPQDNVHRGPAINDRIRAKQVFLIDANNQKVGVVDTIEALRRSHEAGLDLVEVSPEATPPVCRILDFGKFKYEQAKKDKANKAKSKTAEMKEVRLGRSMKIDPHDVGIRIDQAHRFLMEGHKVQIVQNFRGRELMHRDRGNLRMKEIIDKLADVSKVETPPRLAGRRMSLILAPDKAKIDAINRRLAQASKQGQKPSPDGMAAGHGDAAPAVTPSADELHDQVSTGNEPKAAKSAAKKSKAHKSPIHGVEAVTVPSDSNAAYSEPAEVRTQ